MKARVPHATALLVFCLLAGAPAAPEKVIFSDSFDGPTLQNGWSWLREHGKFRRLRDGALEIRVEPGVADSVKNALLRAAPDRAQATYAIEITVHNLTKPTHHFEQAGLTWYHNGKPVTKFVKELVNGEIVIIPGRKPIRAGKVRLRLVVDKDSWSAHYQPNAEGPFLEAARGKLPPPDNDQISIQCYNGPPDAEHWIRFDDFRITEIAP